MADEAIQQRTPTKEELEKFASEARKNDAEAAKLAAETRAAEATAREAEAKAATAEMELEKAQSARRRAVWADVYDDHVYKFLTAVDDPAIGKAVAQLDAWHREDPKCDLTIVFDSPGGGVIEGFHLYDHIRELADGGHKVTTITRGYAASMGGILMQSGDWRVMGPNSTLMIHEVSLGSRGKIGEVEDTVEFAKMLWARALDIFSDRCRNADTDTATKRLSRSQLDRRSRRKDWWIDARSALSYGLIDEIR